MGYGRYDNHAGRPCGYAVEATCDHPGCEAVIDRGLGYLCGTTETIHGGGPGCGGYFCETHLRWSRKMNDGRYASLCDACKDSPDDAEFFEDDHVCSPYEDWS